jgi:hypothetical protein
MDVLLLGSLEYTSKFGSLYLLQIVSIGMFSREERNQNAMDKWGRKWEHRWYGIMKLQF